jgi:protein involved in polysaccharide export with SLBB domain
MILAITLVTQVLVPWHQPKFDELHIIRDNMIDVSISGAVESPGMYRIKRGSMVKDLVALATPLKEANITKVNLTTRLTQGRHVKIPLIETVTIRIDGAVEVPITIKVVKGTKLKELFDCVAFTETAETKALLKERAIRDGETVTIPEKKKKAREKYCKKT